MTATVTAGRTKITTMKIGIQYHSMTIGPAKSTMRATARDSRAYCPDAMNSPPPRISTVPPTMMPTASNTRCPGGRTQRRTAMAVTNATIPRKGSA